jgi:hypothetical protein
MPLEGRAHRLAGFATSAISRWWRGRSGPMDAEGALKQLSVAERSLKRALAQHRLAPPDAGYARRLRDFADACEQGEIASYNAARVGITFDPPSPGGPPVTLPVPHELAPDSGRLGPAERWEAFDRAIADLNRAFEGISFAAIARAFGELAASSRELSQTVQAERSETRVEAGGQSGRN